MISSARRQNRIGPLLLLLAALLPLLFLNACQGSERAMRDGFYSAEAAVLDEHGWKEYITIYVSDNAIVTVDYNAKNASGFIKSWDMAYMTTMNAVDKTYPNKYTREYAEALVDRQDPYRIDVITGATHSHSSFQLLARAAIEQAYAGDKNVAYVDLTGAAHE